ncbi:HERC1 [Symbiodinium sp. KB8]|nr:HERC1 [Symbiodinium sp. KB8]
MRQVALVATKGKNTFPLPVGVADWGGDTSAVQDQLRDVQQIHASSGPTSGAFAAILGDGSVVTWGRADCGGDSSAVQDQLRDVQQIQASDLAFAAILGDGSVVTWGDAQYGGDSSAVQEQLRDVQQIQASESAFAAILGDGSVITWGEAGWGGDSSAVQEQLRDEQQIQASYDAFAAILGDGSVVTWGRDERGGDSSAVREQLKNVQQIQASGGAFAAILGDGSVVTWGGATCGGDSSAVQDQLRDVQQIQASERAFAAILGDGSVVTWGDAYDGGDSSAVQDQLRDVQQIQASYDAFAAILGDGSVVTWGNAAFGGNSSAVLEQLRDVQQIQASFLAWMQTSYWCCTLANNQHDLSALREADLMKTPFARVLLWGDAGSGGDSSAVQDQLRDVQQIQASHSAFAAIRSDGSVVSWGDAGSGGDSSAVQDQLRDVQQIQASSHAFAAIRGDGSVVTWFGWVVTWFGVAYSSAVQDQLRDVQQIQASCGAFAAIPGDGSVVTWGDADYGGDCTAVQDQLRDVQQIQASESAFAAILGDGSVITWGNAGWGGDSSAVQDQLRDVQQIQASNGAFAAILGDRSVVAWGKATFGGDSSAVQDQLRDVQQIQASDRAFAAIRTDGSVVTWGPAFEHFDVTLWPSSVHGAVGPIPEAFLHESSPTDSTADSTAVVFRCKQGGLLRGIEDYARSGLDCGGHHSSPKFRELPFLRMGGGRKQGKPWDKGGDWRQYQPPSWQVWRGAYSPARKETPAPMLQYDQVALPGSGSQSNRGARQNAVDDDEEPEGGLRRDLQKALTSAKKADQKARKIREHLTTRREQWSLYERQMKEAFNTQKKRYEQEVKRLEKDLESAHSAGQQAIADFTSEVQALVAGGARAAPAAPQDSAWEDLIRADMEVEPSGYFAEALALAGRAGRRLPGFGSEYAAQLQQAMLLQAQQQQNVRPPSHPGPMTGPPPGLAPVPAAAPPDIGEGSAPDAMYASAAPRDPYFFSPSARRPPSSPREGREAKTPRHNSRPRPHPYGGNTRAEDELSLEERLRAKRAEAAAELAAHPEGGHPLGGGASAHDAPPPAAAGAALRPFGRLAPQTNLLAHATIEEDDDDLDLGEDLAGISGDPPVLGVMHMPGLDLVRSTFSFFTLPRSPGYLTLIRFPGLIHRVSDGYSAIILDLSRVGGLYFATVLPRSITLDELVQYIRPLTTADEEELYLYIGTRRTPWPAGAIVSLKDGDVIEASKFHEEVPPILRAEAVFEQRPFGPMHHFFRLPTYDGICIMHDQRRFVASAHHHYGETVIDHVTRCLRLPSEQIATCTFPIGNLDVQGQSCAFLVAVADMPEGAYQQDAPERQDMFVLCDFRPLGLKPRFVHTHVPYVHVPSILSNFSIMTPSGMRVDVLGGIGGDGNIRVNANSTLLFFAQELPSDSSEPPSSAQPHESAEEGEAHSSPGLVADNDSEYLATPGRNANAAEGSDADMIAASLDTGFEELSPLPTRDAVVGTDESSTTVRAFVYVPDTFAELIDVAVNIPCGVEDVRAAVQAVRTEPSKSTFPSLQLVAPQPCTGFLFMLAAPSWLNSRPIILFDCQRITGTIFARVVHPCLTRESLLLAAGMPHGATHEVYVHGLLQPLDVGQRITIIPGMLISVVPYGCGAPATFDAPTMLQQRQMWGLDHPLPGVEYHPGRHFLVLTDAWPIDFNVVDGRRQLFRADLVATMRASEDRLTIKASHPRIWDASVQGHMCSGVIVATEQLSKVPCPPARRPEARLILILDCRPMLLGIRWLLAGNRVVPTTDITGPFVTHCPPGYTIRVRGGLAGTDDQVPHGHLLLQHGLVLTLSFVHGPWGEYSDGTDLQPPQPPFDPDGPSDADTAGSPPHYGDGGVSGRAGPVIVPQRGRSRSPRGDGGTGGSAALSLTVRAAILGHSAAAVSGSFVEPNLQGVLGICRVAYALSASFSCSSGLSIPGPLGALSSCSAFHRAGPFSAISTRLLQSEVGSLSVDSGALQAARAAFAGLGFHWPMDPLNALPPPLVEQDDEVDSRSADDGPLLVDIVVCILGPEYAAEHLAMQIIVPQTPEELLDVVETCRRRDHQQFFPALHVVEPQPDARWAVILMVPAWPHGPMVCLDLTAIDGRIFAAIAPWTADRFSVLALASLSPAAAVDVVVPGLPAPLVDGQEFFPDTGMCIRFCPPGRPAIQEVSLTQMLRSHLTWDNSVPFPQEVGDPRSDCLIAGLSCWDGYVCKSVMVRFLLPLLKCGGVSLLMLLLQQTRMKALPFLQIPQPVLRMLCWILATQPMLTALKTCRMLSPNQVDVILGVPILPPAPQTLGKLVTLTTPFFEGNAVFQYLSRGALPPALSVVSAALAPLS